MNKQDIVQELIDLVFAASQDDFIMCTREAECLLIMLKARGWVAPEYDEETR